MSSGKRAAWGEPYMNAVYEWAADLGTETGCVLQVCMVPTQRHNCWEITVRALEVVDGKPVGVRRQRKSVWPDPTYQGLPAHLLREVSALSRELEVQQQALI